MRIGIVAEGGADIAVITNIIKGITGLDSNNIVPLIPRLDFDNTHLSHLDPTSFGGWKLVLNECEEHKKIEEFLSFEDSTHIVIHLDTAESISYNIIVPNKNYHQYCEDIRDVIINKIEVLLGDKYQEITLYAIAVEETDAWLLTIYGNKETCQSSNPKRKLQYLLNSQNEDPTSNYLNYFRLSKPLSKTRELLKLKCLEKNCSLNAFYRDVQTKLL